MTRGGIVMTAKALLLAFFAIGAAHAVEIRPEVLDELLRNLASDSRQVRNDAEQSLLRLGPAVLEELPPPDLTPNANVQSAVSRIRQTLELQAAYESVAPRPAFLVGTKTLHEWAGALERQTGNPVTFAAKDRGQSATLNQPSRSFWQAIDEAGWNLSLSDEGQSPSLSIRRDENRGHADRSGIYRVQATAIRKADVVQVEVQLQGEPRIRPLYATVADADITLRTEATASQPVSPEARREIPMTNRGPATMTIPLVFPLVEAATLQGRLTVKTAARPLPVAFDRLHEAGRVARRRGGVTVTRWQARDGEAGEVAVRITVAYDHGGPEFESHRLWLYHNEAWLETLAGERLKTPPQIESLEESNGALAFEYRFSKIDRPLSELRFVYVVPSLIVDVPVDFRIEGLPIPEAVQP